MPNDPQAGTAAPTRTARATPLFRFDPGWPFVVAGLGLLVAGVLIPAQRELHELENTRAVHAAIEDRSVRQLAAYDRFLNDLDRSDEQLVRRLAASQLNQMPDGERSLMLVPSMNDTVTEWIEGSEPLQLPETAEYPDTLLTRLATGPRRLWVLACGAFLVFIGLLLGPTSLLTMPRARKGAAVSQGGGVAVAEPESRVAPAEPTPEDMMAARAAVVAATAVAASADDSSDEHAACEPSATALAAIESGAVEIEHAAEVTEGVAAVSESVAAVSAAPETADASAVLEGSTVEARASADSDAVALEAPIVADAASFEHLAESCDVVDAHVAVTTVERAVEPIDAAPSAESACMAVFAEPAEAAATEVSESVADAADARFVDADQDAAESVAMEAASVGLDDASNEAVVEIDALETDSSDDDATEDEDESSPSDDEVEDEIDDGIEDEVEDAVDADGTVGEYLFEPSDEYLQTDGGEDIASANTELAPRKRRKKSIASESIDDAYASMTLFDGIADDRWVDTRDPRPSTSSEDSAE